MLKKQLNNKAPDKVYKVAPKDKAPTADPNGLSSISRLPVTPKLYNE